MDLLTVLEHEVGHLLGFDDADTGVMSDTLPAGTRRTPGSLIDVSDADLVDWVFVAAQLAPTGAHRHV